LPTNMERATIRTPCGAIFLMLSTWSLDADTQLRDAASRRMLRAGHFYVRWHDAGISGIRNSMNACRPEQSFPPEARGDASPRR
jgi:hypothetical protein